MSEAIEVPAGVATMAIELLPIGLLDESPTNPRRHYDGAALAELVDDVRRNGVLQPALVREKPAKGRRRFEIVLGHRRLRAARQAGLEALPCVVRELTAEQAFALQLGELHQHADVHYLDEAEAYARSRDIFCHSVEEIAAQVGRSTRLVYQRLQLLHLRPEVRAAAVTEGWNASIAQAVATVTNLEEQARLLKALRKGEGGDSNFRGDKEAPTYRGVLSLLRADFRLALKGAPWKLEDAELVPAAGPCTTCPKRTGSQPELFDEPKDRADVCTDPPCFRGKLEAVWAQRVATAESRGQTVLSPTAAKKLFDTYAHTGSHLKFNAGYVDVAKSRQIGRKYETPRSALRKSLPPIVLARAPDGQIVELVSQKALDAALRKAGRLTQRAPSSRAGKGSRAVKSGPTSADLRRAAIARFRALVAAQLRARCADAAERGDGTEPLLWRFLAGVLIHQVQLDYPAALTSIEQRRALARPADTKLRRGYRAYRDAGHGLSRLLVTASAGSARGIAVEVALSDLIERAAPKTPYGEWLPLAAEVFGIDVEQLEADVAAYLVAVAGPQAAPAKKRKPRANGKAKANGKGGPRGKRKGAGKPRRARPSPPDEDADGDEASA